MEPAPNKWQNPRETELGQTDLASCWTKNNLTQSLTLDLNLDLCKLDTAMDGPPSLSLDERRDSRHLLNVQSLKGPPRQTTVITGLIGPSLGKMVHFHCTKHATTKLSQHLFLVWLLHLEAYSKKKVAYRRRAQMMGLIRIHTSWWKDPVTTLANHHFWGVSLKQDLIGLMTPRRWYKKEWWGFNMKNWSWLCTIPIGENFRKTQRGAVCHTIYHDGRSWSWGWWSGYIQFKGIGIRQAVAIDTTSTTFCL